MPSDLLTRKERGYQVLSINRPSVRNALNTSLLKDIASALEASGKDSDTKAVVIRGEGPHFAAGADVNEIADKTPEEAAKDPRKKYWRSIADFNKPLIVAVEGYCLGGGCELAMLADMQVIAKTAKIGQPEINLGIIPGAGGTQRLTSLVGKARAMRLILTGEIIDGETAFEWGFGSFLCDQGSALGIAEEVAKKISALPLLALAAAKKAVLAASDQLLAGGLLEERKAFEALFSTEDKKEGIAAFREGRKPRFRGV